MTDKFIIFKCMTESINSCWEAFDTSLPKGASDAERSDLCCRQCQCFCFPIFLVYDIVSCPIRGTYYCAENYCCNKTNQKVDPKADNIITTQPN